jgi:hypothetical protein
MFIDTASSLLFNRALQRLASPQRGEMFIDTACTLPFNQRSGGAQRVRPLGQTISRQDISLLRSEAFWGDVTHGYKHVAPLERERT